MQSTEEFMREYLRDCIAEEEREQANRAPFRKKYFTDHCGWNSRAGTLEMKRSEKIVSVVSSDTEAKIVTIHDIPFSPDYKTQHLRYHLEVVGGHWLIQSVDVGCFSCAGESGNDNCMFCRGTGWLDVKGFEGGSPRSDYPSTPPRGRF